MSDLTVQAVLFEPAVDEPEGAAMWGTVGLVYDDDKVAWGELVQGAGVATYVPWDRSRMDEWARALVGSRVGAPALLTFLDNLDLDQPGDDRLRRGVEQALVTGLARMNRSQTADVLAEALAIESRETKVSTRLIIEVENQVATADVLRRMIALQPDGLGYRLAEGNLVEAIGPQAEYLQRFVRELAIVLSDRDYLAADPPAIYLGSNGVFGSLTVDPMREMGRVLGHCAGLEQAAGNMSLWLEDPVISDDELLHVAALNQLRDFMRVRGMHSRIIDRSYANTIEGLQMLIETDAVDGICLITEEWGGLKALYEAIRLTQSAGKLVVLCSGHASYTGLHYLLSISSAVGAEAVLVSMGEGSGTLAAEAQTSIKQHRARQHYLDRRIQ